MSNDLIQRVGFSPMPQSFGARYTLAEAGSQTFEPVRKHTWEFQLVLPGGKVGDVPLSCQEVKEPCYEADSVGDIWHMNEVTHYLNRAKPSKVTAKVLDVINPNMLSEFWQWWVLGIDENLGGTFSGAGGLVNAVTVSTSPNSAFSGPIMGYASSYKRSFTLQQYDIQGSPVRHFICYGGFLTKAPCNADMLDYKGDEAITLDLDISIDRYTMIQDHP